MSREWAALLLRTFVYFRVQPICKKGLHTHYPVEKNWSGATLATAKTLSLVLWRTRFFKATCEVLQMLKQYPKHCRWDDRVRGELGGKEEVVCGVEKARKQWKSDPNHHLTSFHPSTSLKTWRCKGIFKLDFAAFFLVVSLSIITSLNTVLWVKWYYPKAQRKN